MAQWMLEENVVEVYGCSSWVENLPGMDETVGLISSTMGVKWSKVFGEMGEYKRKGKFSPPACL